MDEKGDNTFPFHNLPPELKKISLKVFPVLFHLSFWIKEKSVATLAKPQHLQTQMQNNQVNFGSLFGLLLKILHPDLGTPFR